MRWGTAIRYGKRRRSRAKTPRGIWRSYRTSRNGPAKFVTYGGILYSKRDLLDMHAPKTAARIWSSKKKITESLVNRLNRKKYLQDEIERIQKRIKKLRLPKGLSLKSYRSRRSRRR